GEAVFSSRFVRPLSHMRGDTDWGEVPAFGQPPAVGLATVRPSAYGVIPGRDGLITVVRTSLGLFLPGGGSDTNESPIATVIRETREECGLSVRVGGWRRAAVEHSFSITERAQFEKHSTFCDAALVGVSETPTEPDHALEWMFGED